MTRRRASPAVFSYWKTTIVAVLIAVAALGAVAAAGLHRTLGAEALDVVAVLAALGALSIAASGLLAAHRARRAATHAPDLFLKLNQTRSAGAIATQPPRHSFLGRLLARSLLGHDVLVGDEVEVRPLPEILATLDARGELDGLPFMPEMTKFCGARARVFRCADKIYDYGRTKRMRRLDDCVVLVDLRCDGAAHGGCQAGCFAIWKTRWLKHASPRASAREAAPPALAAPSTPASLSVRDAAGNYRCQFTQLQSATRQFVPGDLRRELRPLMSGNVTLSAFLVAVATRWFNTVQSWRGGVGFPAISPAGGSGAPKVVPFQHGDRVTVRPIEEIEATLDRANKNRGLWFDAEMTKHCGHEYRVQGRIDRIIDAASGRMLEMKSPCIVLEDVECSGEFQCFGPQHEYLYWRDVWLATASPGEGAGKLDP